MGYNGAFDLTWVDADATITASTAAVMGEFFHVAGVVPVIGRVLTRDDDRMGAANAVVLSYGAWQRLFGGSAGVIGRSLVARNRAFTIVGVVPADFEYPRGAEVWTTLTALAATETNEAFRTGLLRDVEVVARLRPGVTYEQATSELSNVMVRLDAQASDYLRAPLAWPRFNALLLGVFALAALLLSSIGLYCVMAGSVRQRYGEIGVRVALGATSADVRRLVLGEGLRLTAAGALVGLAIALLATRALQALLFETQPLDPAILLFAAIVLVGASLVACYVPARRATQVDAAEMLRAE